jgi:hypothetical protein
MANQFNKQINMDLIKGTNASNVYLGYVLNGTSGLIDKIAFAYLMIQGEFLGRSILTIT